MKHFLLTNWCKLSSATAMLIFACALFIFSVKSNSVIAGDKPTYNHSENPPEDLWIVANNNGIFEVSGTQLNPSTSVKLSSTNRGDNI